MNVPAYTLSIADTLATLNESKDLAAALGITPQTISSWRGDMPQYAKAYLELHNECYQLRNKNSAYRSALRQAKQAMRSSIQHIEWNTDVKD